MRKNDTMLHKILFRAGHLFFSSRTLHLMRYDLVRLRARLKRVVRQKVIPQVKKLNLGCGSRKFTGWLNVDASGSDYDVDLACGSLPWKEGVFDVAVSFHFIEHLELLEELIPLLNELNRVLIHDGRIWLSSPDIEKICSAYQNDNLAFLLEDRKKRWKEYELGKIPAHDLLKHEIKYGSNLSDRIPVSHLVNDIFHQWGQHRNLFDFKLLEWALNEAGFKNIERVDEKELIAQFPEITLRNDISETIYVRAVKK